jgi:hypothetical protein
MFNNQFQTVNLHNGTTESMLPIVTTHTFLTWAGKSIERKGALGKLRDAKKIKVVYM